MRYSCLLLTLLFVNFANAQTKPELQKQLRSMAQQSQQIQATLKSDSSETLNSMAINIAKLHTQTLNEIVQLQGWPTKEQVTEEGVKSAFDLAKHSNNVSFQQDMLPLIIQSYLNKDGITGQDVAQFTDNVSIKLGKKQVFGTQAHVIDGQVVFFEIENEQSADQLREQMGMPSLKEYKSALEIFYDLRQP